MISRQTITKKSAMKQGFDYSFFGGYVGLMELKHSVTFKDFQESTERNAVIVQEKKGFYLYTNSDEFQQINVYGKSYSTKK